MSISAHKYQSSPGHTMTTTTVAPPGELGGIKHDTDKPPMELIPYEVLEEVALVLKFGAKKYSSWNWFAGFVYGRLIGAALRHVMAFQRGEDDDKESGLSHISHAICCLLFLRALQMHGRGQDDRMKRTNSGERER